MRGIVYRLLFTRDDDLDLLQVLFLVIVWSTLRIVNRLAVAGTPDAVVIEGLETLRWMIGLLVLTAVPKWLVPTVASRFLPTAAAPPKPDLAEPPIAPRAEP